MSVQYVFALAVFSLGLDMLLLLFGLFDPDTMSLFNTSN